MVKEDLYRALRIASLAAADLEISANPIMPAQTGISTPGRGSPDSEESLPITR